MKISVERSGGFAGLTEKIASVDTKELVRAKAEPLEKLIERVGFFGLPAVMTGNAVGADQFKYEITVEDGARHHSVAFVEDDSPQTAPLRGLVKQLQAGG